MSSQIVLHLQPHSRKCAWVLARFCQSKRARPSNVIEVAAESGQGDHSAPYPRALVEFFVKAFSDAGDIVYDCFTGSGTSIAAAHVLNRIGLGCEISPAYCDVALRRIANLTDEDPVLAAAFQRHAAGLVPSCLEAFISASAMPAARTGTRSQSSLRASGASETGAPAWPPS